jgi:hypothetical protein
MAAGGWAGIPLALRRGIPDIRPSGTLRIMHRTCGRLGLAYP